jgi:hypothetical protein
MVSHHVVQPIASHEVVPPASHQSNNIDRYRKGLTDKSEDDCKKRRCGERNAYVKLKHLKQVDWNKENITLEHLLGSRREPPRSSYRNGDVSVNIKLHMELAASVRYTSSRCFIDHAGTKTQAGHS